jgi:hypothetical protein
LRENYYKTLSPTAALSRSAPPRRPQNHKHMAHPSLWKQRDVHQYLTCLPSSP